MKKIIFLICLLIVGCFYSMTCSAEIYLCENLQGWDNINENPQETETFSPCYFDIDDKKVMVKCGGENIKYPLVLVRNNEDRADIVGVADFTSEIYTIDKNSNQLFYVKNGIINKGYSMMMKAKCKRK